jgi:glyoxylase-like metal-dependent hydrolase (beta-lactamase superfamily II)
MLGTGDCFDFYLSDMHITALCDVAFDMDKELLIGASAEAIDTCLPGASTPAAGTAYLVRQSGMTVLVDAGACESFDGHMHEALTKAGVAPGQIDHILITHLHLDHVGGLLRDDAPVFTNAQICLAEPEHAFWHDDAATAELAKRLAPKLGDDFIPTHVNIARDTLAAYSGKVRLFSGERQILPGVTAVPLYGHTPGHCGYVLGSGREKFFIWGDAVHVAAVQFALPEAGMVFDWDAGLAVTARRRAFDIAASNDWQSAGMHLPFPGIGKVRKDGADYRFIPAHETP